jgi:hypothetical protein
MAARGQPGEDLLAVGVPVRARSGRRVDEDERVSPSAAGSLGGGSVAHDDETKTTVRGRAGGREDVVELCSNYLGK